MTSSYSFVSKVISKLHLRLSFWILCRTVTCLRQRRGALACRPCCTIPWSRLYLRKITAVGNFSLIQDPGWVQSVTFQALWSYTSEISPTNPLFKLNFQFSSPSEEHKLTLQRQLEPTIKIMNNKRKSTWKLHMNLSPQSFKSQFASLTQDTAKESRLELPFIRKINSRSTNMQILRIPS